MCISVRALCYRWVILCALITSMSPLAGCSATIRENHYFASFDESTPGVREPIQFFRVTVKGSASFSNVRYLTGYFDERAVALFFNEIRAPENGQLFRDGQVLPGTDTKVTPLNAPTGEGSFVLIMSTNADSIANSIGSFAEAQIVADALTAVLNRDVIKAKLRSDSMVAVDRATATAMSTRLQENITAAATAADGKQAAASYLRALTALAQAAGYSGPDFASEASARVWFALEAER